MKNPLFRENYNKAWRHDRYTVKQERSWTRKTLKTSAMDWKVGVIEKHENLMSPLQDPWKKSG